MTQRIGNSLYCPRPRFLRIFYIFNVVTVIYAFHSDSRGLATGLWDVLGSGNVAREVESLKILFILKCSEVEINFILKVPSYFFFKE